MWYNAGSDCGVKIIYLCRMGGNMNIQIFGTKKNFDSKKAESLNALYDECRACETCI